MNSVGAVLSPVCSNLDFAALIVVRIVQGLGGVSSYVTDNLNRTGNWYRYSYSCNVYPGELVLVSTNKLRPSDLKSGFSVAS